MPEKKMKIRKLYTFSNKKQIWRLIPTQTDKLIIEERDPGLKEVFFSCIDIGTGRKFFNMLQFEEKYWIGIEKVHRDIIFFHKFKKPDMPVHTGITAFDIVSKKILWRNDEYIFLFIHEDELYCCKETMSGGEGRRFFKLDIKSGNIVKEYGTAAEEINILRGEMTDYDNQSGCYFTKFFAEGTENDGSAVKIINSIKNQSLISGKIEYIVYHGLVLLSYHEILPQGGEMRNLFRAVDIDSGKVIFDMELDKGIKNFVTDSFFIKDDLLFLIKNKSELITCSVLDRTV